MLLLKAALYWIDCNANHYYDFDEEACISIGACLSKNKYIYNETCTCDNKYVPVTSGSNKVYRNADGTYYCPKT